MSSNKDLVFLSLGWTSYLIYKILHGLVVPLESMIGELMAFLLILTPCCFILSLFWNLRTWKFAVPQKKVFILVAALLGLLIWMWIR